MLGEHHDLHHEFPEFSDQIHQLKINNRHFARLFDKYHEVDKEIIRIEQGLETPPDEYLENRKKERLALKDELYQMLVAESA